MLSFCLLKYLDKTDHPYIVITERTLNVFDKKTQSVELLMSIKVQDNPLKGNTWWDSYVYMYLQSAWVLGKCFSLVEVDYM